MFIENKELAYQYRKAFNTTHVMDVRVQGVRVYINFVDGKTQTIETYDTWEEAYKRYVEIITTCNLESVQNQIKEINKEINNLKIRFKT